MLGYTRKKIREALVESLSGISTVGGRVVAGDPAPDIGLPNITYTIESDAFDDSSSYMVSDDNPGEREIRIVIEGRALIADGSDAPIDDLCLEIEKEIASGSTLNDWCRDLRLESTDYEMMEHELPIGSAVLIYVGNYQEAEIVTFSDFTDEKTDTTIRGMFNSSTAGKAQLALLKGGTEFHYSDYGTGSTTSHDLTVTGLTANSTYAIYGKINADAYGIDITDGPEEGNFTNYLGVVKTLA